MRDILVTLIVVGLIPYILRRPEVGAYAWAWISIMNPHRMCYGFAASLPFAQLIAVLTFISYFLHARKNKLPMNGGVVLLLMLMVWMTVTSVFSINDPSRVWERWIFVTKINVMVLLSMMLLRGRKQIDEMVWVVVGCIAFFSIKGGLWTLATGGSGHVYGPPGGMLVDNNAFAVSVIIVLPLMYYLHQVSSKKWVRHGLLVGMGLSIFAILGSQSRGGLLGMLAVVVMLGIKSKYPVRSMVALATLVIVGVAFMPDSWTQRMDTIQGYEGDTSAMSRIWTWTTLWNVALARPLVGAGFGAEDPRIFALFAPTGPQFEVFQGKAWVAHSIYFQALGEHGFPGLIIFLLLGVWIWWAARGLSKQAMGDPELEAWVPLLMRMCQASLLGFAVGGAFLSLMNLDLPYYLLIFIALTQLVVRERIGMNAKGLPSKAAQLQGLPGRKPP
jgi:putative inorganic carbon (HCO3(-)) transporter